MGLALQCCLDGDRVGFHVFQLSDRRFRFSVASNRVGHFMYGLRDRVWPDFVCHFTLFRGDTSACYSGINTAAEAWVSGNLHLDCPSVQGSMAIRTNLDFLKSPSVHGQSLVVQPAGSKAPGTHGSADLGIHFGSFLAPGSSQGQSLLS